MFRFNSVGLLLYLILLSILSFFLLILGLKVGVALYFYVTLGRFELNFTEAIFLSARGGAGAGSVLGLGMWIANKMKEKK